MSDDVKALIAEAREADGYLDRSVLVGLIRRLAAALEASQQAPAVDREALAQWLYESAPEAGKQGFEWGDWGAHEARVQSTVVRDSYRKQAVALFASGILQDAAEVEARGLEKAAGLIRSNPLYEESVDGWTFDLVFERAQQVREGNA